MYTESKNNKVATQYEFGKTDKNIQKSPSLNGSGGCNGGGSGSGGGGGGGSNGGGKK